MSNRPETGPMQFGEDWPGVFIRGDNAMAYALNLRQIADDVGAYRPEDIAYILKEVYDVLMSCIEHPLHPDKQVMKKFEDCVVKNG